MIGRRREPVAATWLFAAAAAVWVAYSARAGIVFEEDFESPDVTTNYIAETSQETPPGWVRADDALGGGYRADYHGIVDTQSGSFTDVDDPGNRQAYAFRYTNSGLTTDTNQIAWLTDGTTYTATFEVMADYQPLTNGISTGTAWRVQWVAFAEGAARYDVRTAPSGSLTIASMNGHAPGDGTLETISFSVTGSASNHAGYLGFDLGLQFRGAIHSANIDNIVVEDDSVPVPPTGTVLVLY